MHNNNFGASAADWDHLSLVLGLTADLLPVVSNPGATISPRSHLKGLGKVPSLYNPERQVVGIAGWTDRRSQLTDVERWARDPDLGICVQTRLVRALDVDVPHAAQALAIEQAIAEHLGLALPARRRGDSAKFLLAFVLRGDHAKRRLPTEHGVIELLATGQQFVALGTHPSGARYEWPAGLPDDLPELTLDQADELWRMLEERFGVAPASTSSVTTTKAQKLDRAIHADPVAEAMLAAGQVLRTERDGRLHITCPFEAEHTSESSDSATTYWPRHTGGYEHGHFHCLHAHCSHRTDADFLDALGIRSDEALDDFDVVAPDQADGAEPAADKPARFQFLQAAEFAQGEPMPWIVKGVLPAAGLAVLFGESGSGKSFFALDLVGAVARGVEWRGRRVLQGGVAYIVAEGAGGFRNRLRAYADEHGVDLAQMPVHVLGDAPNFMERADVKDVIASVKTLRPRVIVVDTFAQVMPGANENSGEDVGRALAHCRALHKATGALVLLVHHSGKDSTKGARGWSGLRAACDVEIEVVRSDDERMAQVTKQKDGHDGEELPFRLVTVVLGTDADGDEITSCVVRPTVAVPRAQRKQEPRGAIERLVLAQAEGLAELPGDVPVAALLDAVVDQMVAPEDGKRDRRREIVLRAVEALVAAARLSVAGGVVSVL